VAGRRTSELEVVDRDDRPVGSPACGGIEAFGAVLDVRAVGDLQPGSGAAERLRASTPSIAATRPGRAQADR
jgi:hypothetical protein